MDDVLRGFAGDETFDPALGRATIVAGPERGTPVQLHEYRLSVAHVAPKYVRFLVSERYALAFGERAITSLDVLGSRPLDDTDASVRDEDVRRWLRDPDAFAGRYRQLAFPVSERRVRSGLSVQLRMGAKVTRKAEGALRKWLDSFELLASSFPPIEIDGGRAVASLHPAIQRSSSDLSFRYPFFDARLRPATDVLVNALHCFSAKVLPIREVVLGAPW